MSIEPLVAVIDDDGPFRTALLEALVSFGFRVQGFASAEEFITADAEPSYGCIITDIHMPGMSGLDLQQHLASRNSKVPIIMITARSDERLEAKVADTAAVCLLRKPFAIDDVVTWLERLLKK